MATKPVRDWTERIWRLFKSYEKGDEASGRLSLGVTRVDDGGIGPSPEGRDMLQLEQLRGIRAELKALNIHLQAMTGLDLDGDDFNDH